MFYSESLFLEFEKKSACHQFGFINQSVKDVTEIARCRVRDGGVGGQQTGIFLSLLRQNCHHCLYMNLGTTDVLEHRPRLLKLVFSEMCVYTLFFGNIYLENVFFESSEILFAEWRVTG